MGKRARGQKRKETGKSQTPASKERWSWGLELFVLIVIAVLGKCGNWIIVLHTHATIHKPQATSHTHNTRVVHSAVNAGI
ncbi:uncharacterized protein SPSK_08206 [Sporothrix schenckii 1099-18]|uniref:Uncharacterized protein n=1 Tax=Sporothrix schenckii 1099-18 TaxID=1397361 RepID=A0A0F2MIC1_SPOSC|nr:uncharacterized protein SPSK_08206 [Sporothrix schenckii 1099-18]KJR88814.1 hypothetical protein SPSK_08206 [Sporothrix schenckii 1099-18]